MSLASPASIAAVDPHPGARQLERGITATWWYTVVAVVFFEFFLLLIWALQVFSSSATTTGILIIGIGGLIWWLSTFLLLARYRRSGDPSLHRWAAVVLPLLVALAYGVAAGLSAGSWLLAAVPLGQSVVLLAWPKGVRIRVVGAVTIVLLVAAAVDGVWQGGAAGSLLLPSLYAVLIPAMSVSSLWWWDVLLALDQARAAEGKLAATQERLRMATDVHDLQGHHLQVIALQLELAERLMPRDPDAGREQLRLARASVDEARQGTRDLATRFRAVPLGDELANARDLLRAAGYSVTADIAVDAAHAPADVLGPVVRETTTNVLRHGSGTRAKLVLTRDRGGWRYEIENDTAPGEAVDESGSGLDGLRRRLAEAGGAVEVTQHDGIFAVIANVPDTGSRMGAAS